MELTKVDRLERKRYNFRQALEDLERGITHLENGNDYEYKGLLLAYSSLAQKTRAAINGLNSEIMLARLEEEMAEELRKNNVHIAGYTRENEPGRSVQAGDHYDGRHAARSQPEHGPAGATTGCGGGVPCVRGDCPKYAGADPGNGSGGSAEAVLRARSKKKKLAAWQIEIMEANAAGIEPPPW